MELTFERGRADTPAGHALVYFTNPADHATLATYLVVLPISLQLSKYVPPMLAAQLPLADLRTVGAVPLPPIPEPVESLAQLRRLAELRHDDLIDAGSLQPSDLARAMTRVAEIAQRYAELYEEAVARAPAAEPSPGPADDVTDVTASDVIYGLLSEQQKLAELAKLAGQLRYAVDGGDQRQAAEVAAEIERLARHLPATYDVAAFVAAATQPGEVGRALAALYLDRCYKLANEDYRGLAEVDQKIKQLREGA